MNVSTVGLSRSYPSGVAVDGVDLRVERGQTLALIGPSGSGKTTLLRLIHLLDAPTSGRLYVDGVDTQGSENVRLGLRRRMAMVFQRPVPFHTTVFENVAYGLRVRGVKGPAVARRVSRAMETVELEALTTREAHALSGGELQRVALARAMVTEPELLLLDEPTANLDPANARRVETLVRRVMGELKGTVLMATHDMAQGRRLASRMGVMLHGRLLQAGTPDEVFRSPESRAIAELVGVENIFPGTVASRGQGLVAVDVEGTVVHAAGDFQVGDAVLLFVRPEEVILARVDIPSSARNRLPGCVTLLEYHGALVRVGLDCGFPLFAYVTAASAEEMALSEGTDICAMFKATGVHVVMR